MASQVVANCRELAYLDNDLRLGLIRPQHLEWHCFVVEVSASGDRCTLVIDNVRAREWRVLAAHDSHLRLVAIDANEANVETNTVASVCELGAVVPDFKPVVKACTLSEYGLLDPTRTIIEVDVVGRDRLCSLIVAFERTGDPEFTRQWLRRKLYLGGQLNCDRRLCLFRDLDGGDRFARDQFPQRDVVHVSGSLSDIGRISSIGHVHSPIDVDPSAFLSTVVPLNG